MCKNNFSKSKNVFKMITSLNILYIIRIGIYEIFVTNRIFVRLILKSGVFDLIKKN